MIMKLQQLIRDPEGAFDEPGDVVDCVDLSRHDKIVVLESWRADLIELQKATDENMSSDAHVPGETAARLAQVAAAIMRLRKEAELGP
jgi:hypothetical protein